MMLIAAALALLPFVFTLHIDVKRGGGPGFVSTKNSQFFLNGQPFPFTATNAYWLHQLSDVDIANTMASIEAGGLKVITTHAFDDVVNEPPSDGATYFQLFQGGKITLNPSGLKRLDALVQWAEHYGLKLVMTLTGNWYPSTEGVSNPKPHGGADVYVQQLSTSGFHDAFYTDPTIINAFKNYVRTVVTRYTNSTAILSWQIMDDPQCASTLPASPSCTAQTLIDWHNDIYNFIKSIDSNHLVSTGDTWFYYESEPVYPGKRRDEKRTSALSSRAAPSLDYGASQIVSHPGTGGTSYGRWEPTQQLIDSGNAFIDQLAATAASWGIPVTLTSLGVVTRSNAAYYIPRNSSEAVPPPPGAYFPTDEDQGLIYTAWFAETRTTSFGGLTQYQWSQSNLDDPGTNPIIVNGQSPNDGYAATPEAIRALELNAQLQV
ncbi:glycoside hydrolase family 5 protein [Botryobasidium botryosum FD-172 SS1]|uniref:mannan endo-1,4-beta-mannosidase n=1 Tax=Botryobasidium botryosum (strain FD-172 SS1) TaxID=930990 RepID=A0A067M772_BOTB1|nr:glycoside hydrolase family 5 protein [Botryobasidium botryosum FD-172 SS1]